PTPSLFYAPHLCAISRPPPTSTLVPYTTLFRSHPGAKRRLVQPLLGQPAGIGALRFAEVAQVAEVPERLVEGDHERPFLRVVLQDRKSTRLNSSHVSISYAVFCLKKRSIATDGF